MGEPNILTIERAKWRRGLLGKGETALLNPEGFMCCLGFDALACGLTPKLIMCEGEPFGLSEESVPRDYRLTRIENLTTVNEAIRANDDTEIDEPERERRVRVALIELGWDDVVFV